MEGTRLAQKWEDSVFVAGFPRNYEIGINKTFRSNMLISNCNLSLLGPSVLTYTDQRIDDGLNVWTNILCWVRIRIQYVILPKDLKIPNKSSNQQNTSTVAMVDHMYAACLVTKSTVPLGPLPIGSDFDTSPLALLQSNLQDVTSRATPQLCRLFKRLIWNGPASSRM